MSILLAVVDNADGTGATATISGSAGGSTNIVFVQPAGSVGFTFAGSRTADGTVSLSLAVGYYWAYCLSNGSTLSNVVQFAATSGSLAVYQRCHNAAVAAIAGLTMSGNPNSNLYQQIIEDDRLLVCPAIFVTLGGAEKETGVLTQTRDKAYQFKITLVDVNFQDYVTPQARLLLWRQQIDRVFTDRPRKFVSVPESIRNDIAYNVPVDPRLLSRQRIVQALGLTCTCRESSDTGS